MPTPNKSYYRILQIDPSAEQEVIEGAYRRLASKYHPDKSTLLDATRRMQEINEAYETLRDPVRRVRYDRELFSQLRWAGENAAEAERRQQAEEAVRRAEYERWQKEQVEARRRAEEERRRHEQGKVDNLTCPKCGLSDKVWRVLRLSSRNPKLERPVFTGKGDAKQFAKRELARVRWLQLYYCERDDGVFDPKENSFVPIDQAKDYLYR